MGHCPAEDRESSAGLVNGARENVKHTGHLAWATGGFLDRPLHGEDGAHGSRSVLGGEAKCAHNPDSDHFSPVVTLPLPLQVVGALPALHLRLLPERYTVDSASGNTNVPALREVRNAAYCSATHELLSFPRQPGETVDEDQGCTEGTPRTAACPQDLNRFSLAVDLQRPDESASNRDGDGLRTVARAELLQDRFHVGLHSAFADEQRLRDLEV